VKTDHHAPAMVRLRLRPARRPPRLAFGNQETPAPQPEPSASNDVDRFKRAQDRVLARYALRAQSRFVRLRAPALRAHVLAAGRGDPLILRHG
jgi:hypothetical protein